MTKKLLVQLFLLIEVSIFLYVYLYGKNGLYALQRLRNENEKIEKKIDQLSYQIAQQKQKIDEWKNNDFYKEKMAREELQMSRKDDEIYYLKSNLY